MSGKGNDYVSQLIGKHITGVGARYMAQQSDQISSLIFADNLRALMEMSVERFEWEGLPSTVSAFHIEQQLFYTGLVVWFKDVPTSTNAFFALQGHGYGNLNMYGEHTMYQVTAPNFKHVQRKSTACVPIWANTSKTPDVTRAMIYAQRLTELDISFEINAKNVRRTRTVFADQNGRLTAETVNDQIDRGDPVIFLTRQLEKDQFDTVDFGTEPKNLIDLHIARQRIWSEAMGKMGINNANQDKRERLVSDEVDANDEQVEASRVSPLHAREEAARLINSRWPELNVKVKYREISTETGNEPAQPNNGMEGGDGGELHD